MSFRDLIVVVLAVVSFAVLLTAHISILAALAVRPPRWRAVASLVLPPLAPYWAAQEKLRGRAATWVVAAVTYAIVRLAAG